MLSLSQTAGYAVLALSCLDPQRQVMVRSRHIAEQTGITKPYLSKLLYRLGQAGLIAGKRGYRGGLVLSQPAKTVTLLDVSKAIDGEAWTTRCVLGLPNCHDECPCPVHAFWSKERRKIEAQLRRLTLAQVIQFKERGWRLQPAETTR